MPESTEEINWPRAICLQPMSSGLPQDTFLGSYKILFHESLVMKPLEPEITGLYFWSEGRKVYLFTPLTHVTE